MNQEPRVYFEMSLVSIIPPAHRVDLAPLVPIQPGDFTGESELNQH